MLVQDRPSPHAAAAGQKPPTSPRGAGRRHPRPFAKNLDFATWASEHSSKLLLLLFALASAAAVFLLRGAAPDAAALLCLDRSGGSSSAGPARLPYPEVAWSRVPPLAAAAGAPFASFRAERWIVVAVSTPPTAALAALARVKGWQLLAVGDSHTPAGWELKGAIFLSLELQAQLGYRSVDFLPYDPRPPCLQPTVLPSLTTTREEEEILRKRRFNGERGRESGRHSEQIRLGQ